MPTPSSAAELLRNAESIAGCTIEQLAMQLSRDVPVNLLKDKGWIGQLLERALGASSGSKPLPDFADLGIELKTIPVNHQGMPYESTYVCMVQLQKLSQLTFETSLVKQKLAKVLWIPIVYEKTTPLAERRIGAPLLWSPNPQEYQWLKTDWQELTDLICLGQLDQITSKLGQVLQIRPKAANAKAQCVGIGEQGQPIVTLPRGFYLRSSFTKRIMQGSFIIRT